MVYNSTTSFPAERWFYIFIIVHLLGWTLLPAYVRENLPLDAVEGAIWGHQLEWGYDKNPFLNGWLTALATFLGGDSGWMIYLFSQLSVIICFWVVWQLGKTMLPKAHALIAVMMLEGMQYYNFHAIDFNDNTLELSLWALTIYFFYRALNTKMGKSTLYDWFLTGTFAALGVMAKYYTFALLAAMTLFLLRYPKNRAYLKTWQPYVGLGIFLLIILPHTLWLFFHDFVTVQYVFARTRAEAHWFNHLIFPLQFTWEQLQVIIPACLLLAVIYIEKPRFAKTNLTISPFDKAFLYYVGIGPFLLTILLAVLSGIKLRAGWGMPLLSLWGIILVLLLPPSLTLTKLRRFVFAIFLLLGISFVSYAYSLINSTDPCTANFPGREMAASLTKRWHEIFHKELSYVAGSRWIAGNLSHYSKDKPATFITWNPKLSPWINPADLKKKGGIFVWDISDGESLPHEITLAYPSLWQTETYVFDWKNNKKKLKPIKIGVAFLPPEERDAKPG